jgi:hypothetical protein
MTATQRHIASGFLGFVLLIAMLAILVLSDFLIAEPPPRLVLQQVQIYSPPPPPPPPPSSSENQDRLSSPDLSTINIVAPVELSTMALSINLQAGQLGTGGGSFNSEVGVDWGKVNLSELDSYPMPISSPVFNFPLEATRQGVTHIDVQLHIVIDAEGNAYLVNVLSTTFPLKTKVLEDYVEQVRFTPPTLLGVPVTTEFAWPVNFTVQ